MTISQMIYAPQLDIEMSFATACGMLRTIADTLVPFLLIEEAKLPPRGTAERILTPSEEVSFSYRQQ